MGTNPRDLRKTREWREFRETSEWSKGHKAEIVVANILKNEGWYVIMSSAYTKQSDKDRRKSGRGADE